MEARCDGDCALARNRDVLSRKDIWDALTLRSSVLVTGLALNMGRSLLATTFPKASSSCMASMRGPGRRSTE